jgi:hypothetical protein
MGLAALEDCSRNEVILGIHNRRQVDVAADTHHQHKLGGYPVGVGVLEKLGQVAALDRDDRIPEADAPLRPELVVFPMVPALTCVPHAIGIHFNRGLSLAR